MARIQQPDQEHNGSPRRCDREQSDRRKLRRSSKEDGTECRRLNQREATLTRRKSEDRADHNCKHPDADRVNRESAARRAEFVRYRATHDAGVRTTTGISRSVFREYAA